MSTTTKPIFILVPGAWHVPDYYNSLSERLTSLHYPVQTLTLPSLDAHPAHTDFTHDKAAIQALISHAANELGQDIILVLHSYGGIPGGAAAEDFLKSDRVGKGLKGGIVHIVWIAAFATDVGESLFDARRRGPDPWIDVLETGHCIVTDGVNAFYNDLPADVAAQYEAKLKPQSIGPFTVGQMYAAWRHVESTYVLCELDGACYPDIQERLVKQEGGRFEVVRVESGHSPMLSLPDVVERILRRAAGERELEVEA